MVPDPNIFLWIAASVADDAAINANDIITLLAHGLLANGLITFFIKGNLVFSNGHKILPKIPPVFPILPNWVFGSFVLAAELGNETCNFETNETLKRVY